VISVCAGPSNQRLDSDDLNRERRLAPLVPTLPTPLLL